MQKELQNYFRESSMAYFTPQTEHHKQLTDTLQTARENISYFPKSTMKMQLCAKKYNI